MKACAIMCLQININLLGLLLISRQNLNCSAITLMGVVCNLGFFYSLSRSTVAGTGQNNNWLRRFTNSILLTQDCYW